MVSRASESLAARVAGAEAKTDETVARAQAAIAARVAELEAELADQGRRTLEQVTDALHERLVGAETQAGEAVARATEVLSARVESLEAQTGEAVERVIDIVEKRLLRADESQAAALETLGGEMARISERLADRIDNAERRSAEAIEEVGDKVSEVSERLNQRYERAAAGLSERMRESEERLARVLEETRARLDSRLAEAQRGLLDTIDHRVGDTERSLTDSLASRVAETERGLAERVDRTANDVRGLVSQTVEERLGAAQQDLASRLDQGLDEVRRDLTGAVDARLGDTERGLADRLEQQVGDTRRTLAETLEARVGDTERGLADRLDRTVGETRRSLAETLEARVGDTERGLVSRLELSVGETRRELEATLGARVAETQGVWADHGPSQMEPQSEPRAAVSEFEQRLELTERDATDRLQHTLAQLVSRVDQVAVEELDEFEPEPVALAPVHVQAESDAEPQPEPAMAYEVAPELTDEAEPAPAAEAAEPQPELEVETIVAVQPAPEPELVIETPHGVYGDDGLAPFSAFANADGFRHAPLDLDDPFVPAALAPVTTVLAEAKEPEAPVAFAASAAPQSIADGHDDEFHVDDEFVSTPPPAKASSPAPVQAAEAAPAEEWSFDIEPMELDAPAEAVTSELAPEPAQPVSPTRKLIEEARAKAKAASEEGKNGRKAKAVDLVGAPPPMPGLGGSKLRGPSLVGGLLSRLGKRKDEREGANVRTTALVAGVSFAVSAMGAGAWLLNERSDAQPAQASTGGVSVTTGEAPSAPRAAALTLDAPSSAAPASTATPAPEAAALYAASLAAFRNGDNEAGLRDLRLAADGGHAQAQLYLADLYGKGRGGLERDPVQARRWTASAAALGNRTAQHNLAMAFVEGEGGPTDFNAAAQWFRRAADQGLTDSQYNLGYLFEQGRGVAANPAEAYKWYLIAARLGGDAEARASAERLRPTLTPVAQATAERTALGFQPVAAPVLAAAPAAPGTGQAELAAAQQALSRLGFYRGPTDGTASPALARAIAAWQSSAGLEPTGVVSGETLRQLQTAAG